MAELTEASAPLEESLGTAKRGPGGPGVAHPWWRYLLDPKWIALFLVLSVALPGVRFALSKLGGGTAASENGHGEVTLGEFRFYANARERSPIAAATFSLHLALIPEAETLARARLQSHKYRVQQGVEQLLRQAHGGDFEDPSLGDLRRQLQEQINQTLGLRAVADCVVTNLELVVGAREAVPETSGGLAGTVPWSD